jgi:hypothetical protein
VLYNDYTGESYPCPADSAPAGRFKPHSAPLGAGVVATDLSGHTIESGWVGLCVRRDAARLWRTGSGLSGASYACPAGLIQQGAFKPDVAPLKKPAVGALQALLPTFAPNTARPYGTWITVDRDLHAGSWKMYDDGVAAYAAADAGGALPGVKTPCTGTTSATTPQLCVGNMTPDGACPPKCLNAEWNSIEVQDSAGAWTKVEDGGSVAVAEGQPVRARFSAGNIAEGRWLTVGTTGQTGAVRFGCNENVGAIGCRADIRADTPYLQDATSDAVVISDGIHESVGVVFQMVAEHVAWFGDQLTVTLTPVP